VVFAGKMALLDVGPATAEQLQALKQHPALRQAFTVYVDRQASANLAPAASTTAEAAAGQQLGSQTPGVDGVTAVEGLVQVRLSLSGWRGRMRLALTA
jgi:hypothetical protein